MPVDVKMTSFSQEMKAATLVKWSVDVGTSVFSGDVLAEVESDKAIMDVLAPEDGILDAILVQAGELASVGSSIAQLILPGEDVTAQEAQPSAPAPAVTQSLSDTVNILMPVLAPSMEVAHLVSWLKAEGDSISVGEVIAEVETEKATLEVEAPHDGVISRIIVAAGSNDVPVNTPIALMTLAGDAAGSLVVPEQQDVLLNGKVTSSPEVSVDKPSATPLARRFSTQHGVDLTSVEGTGAKGRVTRADVEQAALYNRDDTTSVDERVQGLFPSGSFESVPHDNMRKTIARRLVESKQTIPHFYISTHCRIDALLELRGRLNNASAPEGTPGSYRLTVNDLVIKAHALALRDNPDANVTWTDAVMLKHSCVDVGVAVSIPGGLITPIIRDAANKPLSVISREMRDLAGRARNKQLKPQEYQGGTTSVSNLGMFEVSQFAAIVNPPHATILAVGAGERRPISVDDEIVSGTMITVTLSTDHRAVDGALAAQVLKAFKFYLEHPMGMLA